MLCAVLLQLVLSTADSTATATCYESGVEYHGGGLENPMVEKVVSAESCQYLCQQRQGCNFWTWVGPTSSVEYYRDTCWLKGSKGNPQSDASCISGPRICQEEPGSCCNRVSISSSGLAQDYQGTRLGHFSYIGQLEGKASYRQDSPSQDNYLYYLDWLEVWYVGDEYGANMGGLINWGPREGDSGCPDQLGEPWSYYQYGAGTANDWVQDQTLRVTCEGPKLTTTTIRTTTTSTARPPTPDPDPCTFGAACDGCGITTEFQGQVYCCASGCDYGHVYVWQENGEVQCNCVH